MNYFPIQMFKILSAGWRRRYLIAIPIILLPLFGGFMGMTSKKSYTAHTSMLIQETAKMNPFLEDLAVSAMLKERLEGLKTLLHSRHILGAVAKELEMFDDDSPNYVKDQAIGRLSSSLKMQVIGKDLIRIELTSRSPEGMAQTLEVVSRHFIEQLLAPERSSIDDSAKFLDAHIQERQAQLNQAEQALAEFKLRHAGALPELYSMNMDRINRLKQSLAEKETELAGAERSVGSFDRLLSSTNPVIGRIEENIISTRSELALARARYTDKHSKIQALLRNLNRLESERQAALRSSEEYIGSDKLWDVAVHRSEQTTGDQQPLLISQLQNLQNAKNKVQVLTEEVAQLRKTIAQTQTSLDEFSRHESEMYKLERDLRVKRELFEDLLQRREMAEVMGSLGQFENGKRIKVIDLPYTPSTPSNLPVMFLVVFGLVGGVFLGTGLATVVELTDSSVRYREQLELLTGLPVLGRLPAVQPTV